MSVIKLYIAIFIIVLLVSCKASRPVQMPAIKNIPDSFSTTKDSSSIAAISWKQFFSDTYLITLIDSALKSNPDLSIALQRIAIAKAQLQLRKGALLPSVNGVVSAGADKYGDYTQNGVGNFDTDFSSNITKDQKIPAPVIPDYFVGVRSSWEIDLWGKLKNRKRAAALELLATQKGRQLITTALVSEIATAYYDLLTLDNELAIIKKNVALQTQALEIVKIQKEGGRATELAVKQFSAQLLNTKAFEFNVKQQMVVIENQLNVLVGRYPQPIARGTEIMRQPLPIVLQTGLPSHLLTHRPDIQQAELELLAARANVHAARAAFLPSLNMTAAVGVNSFNASLLFNPGSLAFGILGGLTAPIFNQNQIKAGYTITNAQNKEAIYNYQKILLRSYSEVVTHLNGILNNNASFKLKDEEVKELTSAVATAKDLYLTGYANYLEIITAQKGVLSAELELVNNKKELFHSVINLYRSLGGGWE